MNRTVEKNKTLLVDGPASVTVVSGKVEVFGSTLTGTNKVVIREGKRLPFAVEEAATFDISLGDNVAVEEVDGTTIPSSWIKSYEELENLQIKPVIAMVLGAVDSGKTSFCTYLVNRLLHARKKVAVLDGDLGQSDIGPPCTVAYAFVNKPITDLFNLKEKNAIFVGGTSPDGIAGKVVEGMISMEKEALSQGAEAVVINTDGWIEGEDAVNYKVQLVEKLNPTIAFCIQQEDKLAPIINVLERQRKVIVETPQTVKQRSKEKRRTLRELGYVKHLRNAKIQSLPLSWLKIEGDELPFLDKLHENVREAGRIFTLLGMRPLHFVELRDRISVVIGRKRWINPENIKKTEEITKKKVVLFRKGDEEGLLTALYGSKRQFLGIGVLQEVDFARKILKISTPVQDKISVVAIGRVKLDKNLKEIPALTEENHSDFAEFKKLF